MELDLFELFRTFPVCVTVLVVIPVAFLTSPTCGAHEFKAYRMQHYDLHGVAYGSRSALVNMEARPITAGTVTRRCIVVKIGELAYDRFKEILEQGAGSVLVLLPRNISQHSFQEIQLLQELEEQMLQQEVPCSVYFSYEDSELLEIYEHIGKATTSDQAGSAVEALLDVASTSGYQIVGNTGEAKQIKDLVLTNIQGRLLGDGIDEQLPTIAVVTHYDSYGIAPGLTTGADSNASGVVALLEIARIFSRCDVITTDIKNCLLAGSQSKQIVQVMRNKLYHYERTKGKHNIVFLLSGGGKFNYLGTRKWIEDQVDNTENSILSEVDYVLCLDSIGGSDKFFMHVSKPPKENTPGYRLVEAFKEVGEMFPELNFTLVHKKVNLAEELVAWEHERFSLRRLPAGTLSHFGQPREVGRTSIFESRPVDMGSLEKHIRFIAEAMARHVYNISSQTFRNNLEIFDGSMSLHMHFVKTWLSHLTSNPRAVQFLTKNHPLLKAFEQHLSKCVKEVKRFTIKAEKRDPDFVFYDALETTMFAYRVKPAIFDLFLAAGIAGYIGLFYLAVMNFPLLVDVLPRPSGVLKTKYT